NVHGLIKTGNPALNPQRIRDIRENSKIPLVLHGGSGISDEDLLRAIDEGIVLIHISTELRVAYRKGLEDTFREKPQDLAPYSFVSLSKELVGEIAYSRMKLFWKIS
ncbi:MAG: class II fructose-bisphosphate aldolase, partial [Candidatus Pacebacteria bacterium]|nr:class II fructose-bisphosphate aldolase [Candidatus Paceibacterota bacterium]